MSRTVLPVRVRRRIEFLPSCVALLVAAGAPTGPASAQAERAPDAAMRMSSVLAAGASFQDASPLATRVTIPPDVRTVPAALRFLERAANVRVQYNADAVRALPFPDSLPERAPVLDVISALLAGSALVAVPVEDGRAVVIRAAQEWRATVVDSASGRPIEGVRAVASATGAVAYTDQRGVLRFAATPTGGTVRLSRLGFRPAEYPVAGEAPPTWRLTSVVSSLSEVVVQAGRTEGYRGVRTSTGLKLDAELTEVPMNVQIVSSDLLRDRGIQRIEDAVETVSAVRVYQGFDFSQGFSVRGIADSYTTLRNGLRDGTTQTDIANIERVEVLKGPNSVTLGPNFGGGGVVNTITKKPQAAPLRSIEAVAGSYDYYRLNADATGPLGRGDRVLYRVVASVQDAGSYRDFAENQQFTIAPSLTLLPTDRDQLFVSYEGGRNSFQWQNGFPTNARFLDLPRDRSFTGPGLSLTDQTTHRTSLEWTHDFAAGWRTRLTAGLARSDIDIGEGRLYSQNVSADGRSVERTVSRGPQEFGNTNVALDLQGRVRTGALEHRLAIGTDWYDESYFYYNELAPFGAVSIANPQFTGAQQPTSPFEFAFSGKSGSRSTGLYIQDLVQVAPKVRLLLGGRIDFLHQYFDNYLDARRVRADDSPPSQDKRRFSPRIGLVVDVTPMTALYANTINAFIPNLGTFNFSGSGSTIVDGTPYPPTVSEQYEIGVKQTMFGGRLLATAAAFSIDRTNVFTVDANSNYVPTGAQRSRGVELDVAGSVTDAVQLVGNAAWLDATIRKDDNIPIGARVGNVPRFAGGAWMTVAPRAGRWRAWRGGLGVQHTGAVPVRLPYSADDTDVFDLPSATTLDGSVAYEARDFRVSLNARNLTDATTWIGDGLYGFMPGRPRDFVLSVTRRF